MPAQLPALSEFHKFAIPTAYGIHHRINEKLGELFEKRFGNACFFFYEYILDSPITAFDDYTEIGNLNTQAILAPFLRRYAHARGLMPAIDARGDFCSKFRRMRQPTVPGSVPITPESIAEYWRDGAVLPIMNTEILRECIETWKTKVVDVGERQTRAPITRELLRNGVAAVSINETPATLRKLLRNLKAETDNEALSLQLREFALVLNPFLHTETGQQIQVTAYSISSDAIFWGECLVIFPWTNKFTEKEKKEFRKLLNELMEEQLSKIYTPVLMLLLNTVYERALEKSFNPAEARRIAGEEQIDKSFLNKIANGDWKFPVNNEPAKAVVVREATAIPEVFDVQIFKRLLRSLSIIYSQGGEQWRRAIARLGFLEKGLLELWSERERLQFGSPTQREVFKDSLLFAKYFVASPALIERVQEAIRLRHQKSKNHPNVVSALVVGGPGSGKDTMAKLIWLFSPGFRFGGLRTFNMAMFRPKEAAVPLLLGFTTIQGTDAEAPVFPPELDGLLLRAMRVYEKERLTEIKVEVEAGKEPGTGRGFAFIFDELNSLDIDTQGALLRFLENAELTPLGGVKNPIGDQAAATGERPSCAEDILVIGVMNEDPHLIMKRQAMDRILQQSELFGTIIGQTVHELFRNQRRLRDDLYYRLIRGGEIKMPSLRERREDIPILVYNNISRLDDLFPEGVKEFEIDLSVYDLLMNPSLAWEGNLRELQTLSRNLVLQAKASHEAQPNSGNKLFVRGVDVRQVLQRHQNLRTSLGGAHCCLIKRIVKVY